MASASARKGARASGARATPQPTALERLRTRFTLDGFGDAMFAAFDQAVADGVA